MKKTETKEIFFDLVNNKDRVKICEGGKGGYGNDRFKTPTNRTPTKITLGTTGQTVDVELELKTLADVGLVGFPNAGKSTLLSSLTNKLSKIGAYHFTTLNPNLGKLICKERHKSVCVADIPGIIENAHLGKGLGIEFLRHIERSSVLIFVIDVSCVERKDPLNDFHTLMNEIRLHNDKILQKPYIVALNKVDVEIDNEIIDEFLHQAQNVHLISAKENLGLEKLKREVFKLVEVEKNTRAEIEQTTQEFSDSSNNKLPTL